MASLRVSLALLLALPSQILASPAPLAHKDINLDVCITLAVPPVVTEIIPFFTETETTIDEPGTYTLGVGCVDLLGLGCIAEVTAIPTPTVATLTAVGAKTTTHLATQATTFTSAGYDPECDCTKDKAYCWGPRATNTTCPSPPSATSVTVTTTTTVTPSCSALPTTPPLSCDQYGYLIQYNALYQVDLETGAFEEVAANVTSETGVNAIGYNVLDNFIYGITSPGRQLVRISASGESTPLATISFAGGLQVGDVDTHGSYWFSAGGSAWFRADLIPGSPTYGTILANGTADVLGLSFADWAYVPVGGEYLWGIAQAGAGNGGTTLARFSLATKEWEVVRRYGVLTTGAFGAVYGINNGTLYASNNGNGEIWAFPILGGKPYLASQGPSSSSNDGARCVMNLLA